MTPFAPNKIDLTDIDQLLPENILKYPEYATEIYEYIRDNTITDDDKYRLLKAQKCYKVIKQHRNILQARADRAHAFYDLLRKHVNSIFIHPTLQKIIHHTAVNEETINNPDKLARWNMWLGGVRSCKTSSFMSLCAWHATGVYPDDNHYEATPEMIEAHPELKDNHYVYDGYKFNRPTKIIVIGLTSDMTYKILQQYLIQQVESRPRDLICFDAKNATLAKGVSGAYAEIKVPHFTNGIYDGDSTLIFKHASQGANHFQGFNAIDAIFMDEEPPEAVLSECKRRLTVTGTSKSQRFLFLSQWPQSGYSEVVKSFLGVTNDQRGVVVNKTLVVSSGWGQNPFMSAEEIRHKIAITPPWRLPAEKDGDPTRGAGCVFAFGLEEIIVPTIPIQDLPVSCRLIAGLDPSATVQGTWGGALLAIDVRGDMFTPGTVIVLRDYLKQGLNRSEHAMNLKNFLPYPQLIPVICDPAGGGQEQYKDTGEYLSALQYLKTKEGFNIYSAHKNNPREDKTKGGAIDLIYRLKADGKFKICANCKDLLSEMAKYSVDEYGVILKEDDHAIDAMFYALNLNERAVQKASCLGYNEVNTMVCDRTYY